MDNSDPVAIVGGGITGLTLALSLHQAGIACRVYEAAPDLVKLGVGINLLPHGVRELTDLGLQAALARYAIETREMCFYNRFGQFIYKEPRGRFAGYDWPQFSMHRGGLHLELLRAVRERLGPDAILLSYKCIGFDQDAEGVTVHFADPRTDAKRGSIRARAALGCDGIHSVMRHALFPDEGGPAYQGINMWRGVTRAKPFLSGSSMILAGWLPVGKMVIYPIGPVEADGLQLINWVAEIQSPRHIAQDWNLKGRLDDFYPTFAGWTFDWLDCAKLIRDAEMVLEYPMVDRDPLPHWSSGRATLVGDAAHPMYPRGGNGAGQGILDARSLMRCMAALSDVGAALRQYEVERLKAANAVVLINRTAPSDEILKIVHDRSGDRPFNVVEDIVSQRELAEVSESYKRAAGFSREHLRSPVSTATGDAYER